eukprot:190842_1
MAESIKKSEEDEAAKIQKLQADVDKWKKVAKTLLTQRKASETTTKKIKEENKTSQQTIQDLQSKLEQSNTMQSQLEDAIEKKNTLITTLEQQISHKEEAEALQTTTSQQVLQELNQKCVDYEQEIATLKTEKEAMQHSNEQLTKQIQSLEQRNDNTQPEEIASIKHKMADLLQDLESKQSMIQTLQTENETLVKYKTEYETLQSAHHALQNEIQTMKQSMDNRQEDTQRAKTLKTKMDTMTTMMATIQNGNQSKITELEEKLALSLQRTREHEIQIKQYESSKQGLLDENRMMNAKYEGVKDTLQQEETRSASLMKLNEALKRSVMNLHQEKDELEDTMQEMQQQYMEYAKTMQTQATTNTMHSPQNDKIMDLRSKTASFKESIRGLKEDMTSITTGFQQQLLSSTQGFAQIHQKMMAQKQKYVQNIETLTQDKEDMMTQYEELSKQFEQLKIQNEQIRHKNDEVMASEQSHSSHGDKLMKQLTDEREEKNQLQILYDTLSRDCKEMQQHLHDTQREYEAYKVQSEQRKETLMNEFNETQREKQKVNDANINKVLQQNEQLKVEMKGLNAQVSDKHKAELEGLSHEKDELLNKYNELCKVHEDTHSALMAKKNEIEELLCNNQNMKDQIKRNGAVSTQIESDSSTSSPTKPEGMKRKQTPLAKADKSLDFDDEIHKQLQDDNASQREMIQSLENELNSINEQYQKTVQNNDELQNKMNAITDECKGLNTKLEAITKEKAAISTKLSKYTHNLKLAMQKAKQYKAMSGKYEEEKNALQTKYDQLNTEYETLDKKLVDKVNELQQKVSDNTKDSSDKYNTMLDANKRLKLKHENEVKRLADSLKALEAEHNALKEELQNKQARLKQMTEDLASSVQRNQILQMEYKQMKEKTLQIEGIRKQHKEDMDKIKGKYKAYISKQKKEVHTVNDKLSANAQRLETLQGIEQKHNELQQKHEALAKEYESKATMANEYESQTAAKYERLKQEFDSAQIERNEMQKRFQTLSNDYEVTKSDLEQAIGDKVNAEKKANDLSASHKESFAKYKEKAKHVVNKHKTNAEKQVNEVKAELTQITQEKDQIQSELTLLKKTKQEFEESISDLNRKLRSNQDDLDKLSKQVIALQETNNDLENKAQTHQTLSSKREETLNAISGALAECSFFKSNESMSIVEGVAKLAHNYEDISIKHSESQSSATDVELKLKEREDKMKRLALTVRKLQSVRKQLQASLDSTKTKLNEAIKYRDHLQTMNTEIQRSLDKWKVFINAINETQIETETTQIETETETEAAYLKRCLSDVRSLSMYFIQSLDMYREKHEEHQGVSSQMEDKLSEAKKNVETLQKELEEARKRIESTDNSQIAKNAHIEALTTQYNHSIACIKENWHHAITKIDFVDISVSTRLMLEDCIWCLIRWRQKEKDKRIDEYFWTSQATYLNKLNVKENEIYLPDFFENKLENQITKSLESKWKAIQRRTDRQIQELKTQKSEEEEAKCAAKEALKQYKAKAKVILQKQKEELSTTQEEIKELGALREEVTQLKQDLSSLSTENWAQKYKQIEAQLSTQKSELQNKKVELGECNSKLLLKERELSLIAQEFDKEKEDMRSQFETEKANAKKKFNAKLDDYRQRAREMMQQKDKQLSIARNRLNSKTQLVPSVLDSYDHETQTEDKETQTDLIEVYYDDAPVAADDHVIITSTDDLVAALQPPLNATIEDKDKNMEQVMSTSNIAAMARMQTQRDHKVREFEDRVRRLQELLNKAQEEHKQKDGELHYLKTKLEQIEQAQDVKKSADNSEYLKNALLQYFDAKININQLVSVAAVGLRFNEEEQKKAKNSKLIHQQDGYIGGYVKSWWS